MVEGSECSVRPGSRRVESMYEGESQYRSFRSLCDSELVDYCLIEVLA